MIKIIRFGYLINYKINEKTKMEYLCDLKYIKQRESDNIVKPIFISTDRNL